MKFTIEREPLLKPLQKLNSTLSGRPTLPILGHVLLQVSDKQLLLTSTDLEVEMIALITLKQAGESGSITVPARKFYDIWRCLPYGAKITVLLQGQRLMVLSGRSRFSLSTLPAAYFPNLADYQRQVEFELPQATLKQLIEATKFSMANQDVRYYLNGMLFQTEVKTLRTVATDGHRLALCSVNINNNLPIHSVIVPRKGVIELMRLLDSSDDLIKMQIGRNNIRVHVGKFIFTSKLVDGRFPDYKSVFPTRANKKLTADCESLKQAFSRAAIFSNEKNRSVRLSISKNQLIITTNNQEHEASEEIVEVNYENSMIEISFNVNYILDVLNTIKSDQVHWFLTDAHSSVQIEDVTNNAATYVVMPIRL